MRLAISAAWLILTTAISSLVINRQVVLILGARTRRSTRNVGPASPSKCSFPHVILLSASALYYEPLHIAKKLTINEFTIPDSSR
jgi:hypothetical protein